MPFASFYSTYSALLFQSLAFKPRIDFQQFWAKVIANEAARILEKKTHTHTKLSLSKSLEKSMWEILRLVQDDFHPCPTRRSAVVNGTSPISGGGGDGMLPAPRSKSIFSLPLGRIVDVCTYFLLFIFIQYIYIYHISCCVDVYIWMIYLKKQGVS